MATIDEEVKVLRECIRKIAKHAMAGTGHEAYEVSQLLDSLSPDNLPATPEIDLCGTCHERPCRCTFQKRYDELHPAPNTYGCKCGVCAACESPAPSPAKCEHANKGTYWGMGSAKIWQTVICCDCGITGRQPYAGQAYGHSIEWWPTVAKSATVEQNDAAVKCLRWLRQTIYATGCRNTIIEIIDATIAELGGAG